MKNIILVVTDTFRHDNLNHLATRPVDTPNLNAFAGTRAASAGNMYTGSFPTIPHRTDLASGRLGWPNYGWQAIDLSSENHIAQVLGDQGYASQLICDCPHLFKARFNPGFDAAFHNRGQEGDQKLLHLNDEIVSVMPPEKTRRLPKIGGRTLADVHRWTNRYPQYEGETFPARTGNLVIRWLEENSTGNPFFLWVDLFDPHEPWDAPEYMVRKYDPDYDGVAMIHPNYGNSAEYTSEELTNLWAHYAAEAELVDKWIGRILEKISDLGLWDDSVVVVTTDHGMSIGEHERTGKSNIHPDDQRFWPIYPEVGHIPFLVAAPGVVSGSTINSYMQPIDILPTVAELAGATLDSLPEALDGFSRADELRGENPTRTREYAVSGCNINTEKAGSLPKGATMPFLVKDNWGYAPIGASGERELFDLQTDPYGERNIAPDHTAECNQMHEIFVEHLRDHRAPAELVDLFESTHRGEGAWAIDYASE